MLEYAAEAGAEQAPLCSGEVEAELDAVGGAEVLLVACRFLALWYAEVSSDAYARKLCRAIPTLCGDGPQWGGQEECRLQGLARLLPALAPLAARPEVADALLAAGSVPHAARLVQQVPPAALVAHTRSHAAHARRTAGTGRSSARARQAARCSE